MKELRADRADSVCPEIWLVDNERRKGPENHPYLGCWIGKTALNSMTV